MSASTFEPPCLCVLGLPDPRTDPQAFIEHEDEAMVPIWLCPAHEHTDAAGLERQALRENGEEE